MYAVPADIMVYEVYYGHEMLSGPVLINTKWTKKAETNSVEQLCG